MKHTDEQTAAHRARRLLELLALGKPSPTDPQGSYTGMPAADKTPVQDADDL